MRLEKELKEKEELLAKTPQQVQATPQKTTPDLGKQEEKREKDDRGPLEAPSRRRSSQLAKPHEDVSPVVNQQPGNQDRRGPPQIPSTEKGPQVVKPQNVAPGVNEHKETQGRREGQDKREIDSDTPSEPNAPVPGDRSFPSVKEGSVVTHESHDLSGFNQEAKRIVAKKGTVVVDLPKALQRALESIKKELLKRNPSNPLQVIQTVLLGLTSDLGAIQPRDFSEAMSGLGLPLEDSHTDLIFENFTTEGTAGLDVSSFLSTLDQLRPARDPAQKVLEESRQTSAPLTSSPKKEAQTQGLKEKTKRPHSSHAAPTAREAGKISAAYENKPKRATSAMNNDERLPEKWERLVTPQGRYYYVDHSNRRTQWEHPVTGKKSQVSADAWPEKNGH